MSGSKEYEKLQRPDPRTTYWSGDAVLAGDLLRGLAVLARTKNSPKVDSSLNTRKDLTVLGDRTRMNRRVKRYKVDGRQVFRDIADVLLALEEAGWKCDSVVGNRSGDTLWYKPNTPADDESFARFGSDHDVELEDDLPDN